MIENLQKWYPNIFMSKHFTTTKHKTIVKFLKFNLKSISTSAENRFCLIWHQKNFKLLSHDQVVA